MVPIVVEHPAHPVYCAVSAVDTDTACCRDISKLSLFNVVGVVAVMLLAATAVLLGLTALAMGVAHAPPAGNGRNGRDVPGLDFLVPMDVCLWEFPYSLADMCMKAPIFCVSAAMQVALQGVEVTCCLFGWA